MNLAMTFWLRTIVWTATLTVVFTLLSLGSGETLSQLPRWLGLGLVLGTFPAGLSVSDRVLGVGQVDWRTVLTTVGTMATVSVVFVLLAGWVGPALQPGGGDAIASDVTAASRALSIPELREAIRIEIERLDPMRQHVPTSIDAWFRSNVFTWDLLVRLSGAVLPLLFGWIGIFAGFWTRRIPQPQIRIAHLLALGLLLVISTYLANENSFEWIVVQAAGPVPVAGLFSLIVPSLLTLGLGWPAVIVIRYQDANAV